VSNTPHTPLTNTHTHTCPHTPAQVLLVVTRWRTEANEARERQGLSRVYLLEHKAAEAEAKAAQAGTRLNSSNLRKIRAAE